MKITLHSTLLICFLFILTLKVQGQNITIEIDPNDIGAVEINQTDDCLRQNNNNWYGNVCDVPNDGDDPENTVCDDCFTGGSEDIDVATAWEAGGNWSAPHVINDVVCGYNSSFNWTPGAGGTNTVWTIAKTETIRVAISGAEDDAGFCSSDLSGSNDGECYPSPYGYATNNLPWAYRTYNSNTGAWYTDNGSGLDIDLNRCPYDWTGFHSSTIENCMKENGTNDYVFRWRYRWHFGNTSGTLSGMDAPDINGLDFTTCSGPYDRTTITASSYTNCDYATQWQVSVNGGAYTDIGGATIDTYDPPSQSCGVYAYRVRKAYRTSFTGSTGYTYSNIRTDVIQTAPTAGGIGNPHTICIGGDPATITNFGSGTGCGTITYIWQSAISPFSSWGTISGATGLTYDPPAGLTATTQYRRITVSALSGGNTCQSAPTAAIQVTVVADPTTPNVTRSPVDGTVCEGQTLTVTSPTSTGGTGICNFEYRYSTNGGGAYTSWSTTIPSFAAVAGASNIIESRRVCNGSGCDVSGTNTQTWTVVADPTVSITGNQSICSGASITLGTTVSGGTGSCTLQWQIWNGSAFVNIGGATGSTYNTGALTTPTQYQVVRTCTGAGCGSVTSTPVIVSVAADPAMPNVFPIIPNVCVGEILTVSTPTGSGGTGTCVFEYQFSTNGGATYSGWSTTVPSFAATGTDNRIQIRTNCNGLGCDISPVNTQIWTVSSDPTTPTVTPSPNVATVCAGQALTVLSPSSTGGVGTCVFQYRYSTNGGSTYSAWSTVVPNFAATGTDNRIQTRRNCSGLGCDISSPHTQIWTVVADPLISASGSTTICSGGTALLSSSTSGGTGTCTYQWLSSPDNTTYTPIVGATSATYTTPALTTQTYYRVQRICNGSDCQTATSNALTISIGVGGTSSITDTICANATYTLPSGLVVLGPGLYSDTIPGAQCDSIITINLITPPSSAHYGLYAADFTSYNQINPLTGALINSYATTPGSSGWVNGAFTMHEQAARAYWISETKQLNSLNLTNGAQTAIPCAIGSMSYFWGLRYYDGYLYTITTSGDNDKVLVRFNPTTGALDGGFSIEINGSAAYEILIHSSPVIDPINGRFYINLYGNRMLGFDIGSGTGNLITLGGYVSPSGFIGLLEINEQTGEMFALSGFSDIVEIAITGATTATVSLVKTLGSGSGFSNPISAFDSDNNLYIFQAESGCATQNPLIAVDVTTGQEWCTNPPGIAFTQLEYLNCKPSSTLREIQPFDVKFFPNPVRGELTLELELEEENDVIVNIYNISGGNQSEQQFNGEAGNNRFSLDFSSLTNGIYIIQVQSGKHRFAGKVIKL